VWRVPGWPAPTRIDLKSPFQRHLNFNESWQFIKDDPKDAEKQTYDDSHWR
jgi:hypothetical protein